jgi:hypothetical protein
MPSTIETDLSGVEVGDIICSIRYDKNWTRTLEDKNGININIHKLKVERSLFWK